MFGSRACFVGGFKGDNRDIQIAGFMIRSRLIELSI